ncbi:polyprotein of EF-Ts, chloroplastic-like isoform X1 [Coffea arabica]|uniref:Elongation factor Ts, mitochondrial n=1 Tax=Coffea arabica TaxID=13443 RepID=A0ABM4UNC5_COFAR
MTPVLPSSPSNNLVNPADALINRKDTFLTRCSFLQKSRKQGLLSQRYTLPMSTSFRLFPQFRIGCALQPKLRGHIGLATQTDVALEETDLPGADKDTGEVSESPLDAIETNEDSSAKSDGSSTTARSKRTRPVRKSDMPPIRTEDLIPGATYTGKVRSIQPFGAFVDFGAFTDGLVHVSRLSDGFVKDVGDVVSVGQEVTVRLVEANTETGRISLTMRESDDPSKPQKQRDTPAGTSRAPRKSNQRRDEVKRSSKFVKGQELDGTVKNLVRAGAFISLPEGEEGFLPTSEEADEGFGNFTGGSSLQVGQEVKVRVLNINRGKVQLTMKKEETAGEFDLVQGVVHTATNPFVLAFHRNKDIATFLDEQDTTVKPTEPSQDTVLNTDAIADSAEATGKSEDQESLHESEGSFEILSLEGSTSAAIDTVDEAQTLGKYEDQENIIADSLREVDSAVQNVGDESEASSDVLAAAGSTSTVDPVTDVLPATEKVEDGEKSELSGIVSGQISSSENLIGQEAQEDESKKKDVTVKDEIQTETPIGNEEFISAAKDAEEIVAPNLEIDGGIASSESLIGEEGTEDEVKDVTVKDQLQIQTEAPVEKQKVISASKNEGEIVAPNPEINTGVASSGEKEGLIGEEGPEDEVKDVAVKDEVQTEAPIEKEEIISASKNEEEIVAPNPEINGGISSSGTPEEESAVNEVTENIIVSVADAVQAESPLSETEPLSGTTVITEQVGPDSTKKGNVADLSEQSSTPSQKEATTKAAISPALVKQLREETGAGMMDCKRALSETGGDMVKAQEYLRKKGLASADKKASRTTAEGRIGSYIHDSRIGVLIEVNCETDFVSRGDIFKELVEDLAMQVAACPQVQYLAADDVPKEIVDKEREIEMQKEDLLSKPEQIRLKIVDGRIRKRLEELALLEQPYIKNDKMVVKDWVKQTIATIGENIKVKRFVRYNLGEGLEKKSQDFATEVAAQTAAKPTEPKKEQPIAVEAKETVDKPVKATISPALVKQLREETGAGMMDCKKALSEMGGDLEKAQEYLRKKGLSSAEKKYSRLAAEGRIGSYIHDSRIGVLIEVNCETDFVGRGEIFKELVDDLAMQVVASPQVQCVSVEDIPATIVNKEKELEMQREDLQSKPENIREKIVEGRVSKRLGELALLEQPFIKNDSMLVKDLVKQTVASLGENIKVRRFVRFTLGEESEPELGEEAAAAVKE